MRWRCWYWLGGRRGIMGWDGRLSVFGGVGCAAAYFGGVGWMGRKKMMGVGFMGGEVGCHRLRGLMRCGGVDYAAA